MAHLELGEWQWVGSEVINFEIEQTLDINRRFMVKLFSSGIHCLVLVEENEKKRGQQLAELGFGSFDALHIACAESSGAEIFLTTDDRLIKLASINSEKLHVSVKNPITWLKEVTGK